MNIVVRSLRKDELSDADRIFRLAFGTFVGLSDPLRFAGDADWITTTWRRDPSAAFAAEVDGRLVGSNFATSWGSLGFFGPLSIDPELWGRGVAHPLMEAVMQCFARWETRHTGLFTFAQSAKHVTLYQRFGFYPRFLTAIMRKPSAAPQAAPQWTRYSEVTPAEREQYLGAVRVLTDAVYADLDLTREITLLAEAGIGETVLVGTGSRLTGVAVCHVGAGSQAGSGACYVKFGAAPSGDPPGFERLLDAVEAFAASQGLAVVAGVNLGRVDAYRRLQARGYRTEIQGVAMHRPNDDAYDVAAAYVLDDWR